MTGPYQYQACAWPVPPGTWRSRVVGTQAKAEDLAKAHGPGRYAIFRRRRGGLGWDSMATLEVRECAHGAYLPAGECELCDIDWLIERGEGDKREHRRNRKVVVAELTGARS